MLRLWVLLIFLWYYSVSMARTESEDSVSQGEGLRSTFFDSSDYLSENQLPFKEGIYSFQPEIMSSWNYDDFSNSPNGLDRKKRSILSTENTHKKNHSSAIVKREVPAPSESNEAVPTVSVKEKPYPNNEYSETETKKLLSLLASYQSIVDNKMSHLFDNSDDKYIMLQKCLHPYDTKKSFSAWGGKRFYDDNEEQMYKECLEMITRAVDIPQAYAFRSRQYKIPFKPWNGKRNPDEDFSPKRLPFRAWGGKRDNNEDGMAPKRIPFRAWGGKRTEELAVNPSYTNSNTKALDDVISLMIDNKREHHKKTKFYSWGGKRLEASVPLAPHYLPTSLDLVNGGFSPNKILYSMAPFGDLKDSSADGNILIPADAHIVAHRRLKFNSWGGKRAENRYKTPDEVEGKRRFNAWGGKRADNRYKIPDEAEGKRRFNAWGGKRADNTYKTPDEVEGKRRFNAWGGKRGDIEASFDDDFSNEDIFENEANKRTFNAWGGK